MTTDELIKALRWVAKVTTYCDTHMVNCHECEFHGFCTDPNSDESIGQQSEWFTQAADELARLAKENAELREAQRWIPVSERLPENGVTVLVCYLGYYDGKPNSDNVAYMKRGVWLWYADDEEMCVQVTHWRPLPELPQKGEQGK